MAGVVDGMAVLSVGGEGFGAFPRLTRPIPRVVDDPAGFSLGLGIGGTHTRSNTQRALNLWHLHKKQYVCFIRGASPGVN